VHGSVLHPALGHAAAELGAALERVLDDLVVGAGVVVGSVLELLVRDGQLETIAEDGQLLLVEFLGLVRDVARLDARAQRPALDRLGQDDRGGAPVVDGSLVGGVELAVVVAAPFQT
jgi:hypothetical protein